MPPPTRQERRAKRKQGMLDNDAVLKLADKFIDLANRQNQRVPASTLLWAFLWAAARYNAHVAKSVLDVDKHEEFVNKMGEEYKDMLRQHLADPALNRSADESAET